MKEDWHPRTYGRRELLQKIGGGIAGLGLASILAGKQPHFQPKIKNVISIFCYGGASHIDTFDPKPELLKRQGEAMTGVGD